MTIKQAMALEVGDVVAWDRGTRSRVIEATEGVDVDEETGTLVLTWPDGFWIEGPVSEFRKEGKYLETAPADE